MGLEIVENRPTRTLIPSSLSNLSHTTLVRRGQHLEGSGHAAVSCQTALALAEYRAQDNSSHVPRVDPKAVVELKVKGLEVVSHAYLQFMRYLARTRGKNNEMWAKSLKLRAREIDVMLYGEAKERAEIQSEGKEEERRNSKHTSAAPTPPTAAPP
ncbi:hypothetical protein B0T24DRAFT_670713 [Lasiosphaeria ovina]|uniref:Uncharacterized protein n=1 Tax=Lasiosphaeria ovina TaxID=92902 RepID=A0AAE0JWP5_9PEZI|nr:hypothetical protein B0T24DRAFT_670713 [Lasiosphaeria ovina]